MLATLPQPPSIADLLRDLGDISPSRICLRPAPGKATFRDVIRLEATSNRLFELVDGVLVEKVMGAKESLIATILARHLGNFVEQDDLGVVLGADGMLRLRTKLVRIPDVSFIAWDQIPDGEFPDEPIPDLYPDLAIEVLSAGDTPAEMTRKVGEYFDAGSRLVWVIDPQSKTAEVFTGRDESQHLKATDSLDGGKVLPGFRLPLKVVFTTKRRRKGR